MAKADLESRINGWLRETGERVCGQAKTTIRVNSMYVEGIAKLARRRGNFHDDSKIKFAVAVYIEEEDSGGDRVESPRRRSGLFVVIDSDLILARDLSWGRTRYDGYDIGDFTADPITFKAKGRVEGPGLRLHSIGNDASFALGLWYSGVPRPKGSEIVRDRMIELVNEAAPAAI